MNSRENIIVFVTSNKGKIKSAEKHFAKYDVKFKAFEYDINEPNVNDIEFIAESKVKDAYARVGMPCISLDAGFFIPSFPGKPNFPGAFPKRELLMTMGITGLIEAMKREHDRNCFFKECLAYNDGNTIRKFFGYTHGQVSEEIRGDDTDKKWSDLWYIFVPDGCTKTLAEMTEEERENRKIKPTNAIEEFAKWYKENNYEKN